MNPHWPECEALKRGKSIWEDGAMAALIFKKKHNALLKFIRDKLFRHDFWGKAWIFEFCWN
jgi:hypothetical protein